MIITMIIKATIPSIRISLQAVANVKKVSDTEPVKTLDLRARTSFDSFHVQRHH